MYLTANNLVHYLLARGQILPESVVDGDFLVAELGRRNRNFKVVRRRSAGLFIKQIMRFEQQAVMTLGREAACYRMAHSDPQFNSLARLMPKLYDYDTSRHCLVLELLPDGENLTEYHQRLRAFPEEVGVMLGKGLGAYHSRIGHMFGSQTDISVFPRQSPWILAIHVNGDAMWNQLSGGNAQLINLVRQYPDYQHFLDQLRAEWRYDSLIHGDMKWDNCMVFQEGGELSFRIVDWELADFGDSAWDVGAIFQAYLVFWIMSMPASPETAPAQLIDRAAYKLEDMQPAIREFWRAYVNARSVDPSKQHDLLERCVRYGAGRMVQTAFEYLYMSPQLTSNAATLLQVSLNILENPKDAVSELFGF